MRVENGCIGGCLVTLTETTGRVRERRTLHAERASVEAAARREREFLAALIRSIPDEVWFADMQKQFTLAGAAEMQAERVRSPTPPATRILLIEDNIDAAQSLCEALELSGHEVMVAHNGYDGIAKARQDRPHFVFCDIGLPGMDGYAVARAFREDETLRNVRLVALSGYALPEDLLRSADAGFEQHIAKPPSLATLAAILGTARSS